MSVRLLSGEVLGALVAASLICSSLSDALGCGRWAHHLSCSAAKLCMLPTLQANR